MDLSIFLNDPKLLHVDDNEKRPITGVTVLGGAFFVIRQSSLVYVYSCDSFRLIRQLNIAGAKYLRGIVSCVHFNCLYVCDPGSKTIYKYDVTSYDISNWSTKLNCEALSVNKTDHNVLATSPDSCNTRRILVYTTHGCLVREIYLDESIVAVRHCVQLSTGNYVVSHSGSTRRQIHRVCIVDDYGRVVRSIGGRSGSGVGQLSDPRHLAVDAYDNILVADFSNNRLQLLSPNLVDLGCLKIPGYRLHDPYTICLDEPNRRLYVGEWGEGRVFVLDAGIDVGNN